MALPYLFLTAVLTIPASLAAQMTAEQYVETYKNIAIAEMHRTGIPASIKLAQGILESGAGNSRLAREANNHFGIKCHKEWNGPSVKEDDDAPQECFRKYSDPSESWTDHSEFLMTRPRYAGLFELDPTDYKAWARGLKAAGYATNPQYAPLLIGIIERMELYHLDYLEPGKAPLATKTPAAGSKQTTTTANNTYTYRKGVFETNRIKTVYLQQNQTLADVAVEQGVRMQRLLKWNEVDEHNMPQPGMRVFLAPKRNKAQAKYHKVKAGETMYGISQTYGVKLQRLYSYNLLGPGQEPADGERLYLRTQRRTAPKLRPAAATSVAKPPVAEAAPIEKPKPQPEHVETATSEAPQEQVSPSEKPESAERSGPVPAVEPRYSYRPKAENSMDTPPTETAKSEAVNPLPEPRQTDEPQSAAQPAAETTQTDEGTTPPRTHAVAQGETLYSLSRMYGTTIHRLMEWNRLDTTDIQIGQVLVVGVED